MHAAGFCSGQPDNRRLRITFIRQIRFMNIKKVLGLTLKIVGGLLLILLVTLGIVYYTSINYSMPSLYTNSLTVANNSPEAYKTLANNLVAQMSFEEKISQMTGPVVSSGIVGFLANILVEGRFPHVYIGENERLGIPPWVLSDGPRGARVRDQHIEGVTTFPVGMARGASWEPELEYRINEVIAAEMRANKVNYAATPCINLLRHPGWGRAQETYGEAPGRIWYSSCEGN